MAGRSFTDTIRKRPTVYLKYAFYQYVSWDLNPQTLRCLCNILLTEPEQQDWSVCPNTAKLEYSLNEVQNVTLDNETSLLGKFFKIEIHMKAE